MAAKRKKDSPVNSRSGHSKNWWAKRLLRIVEPEAESARLEPARRLARRSGKLEPELTASGLHAVIADGAQRGCKTSLAVAPLSEKQWDAVMRVLTDRAVLIGQLLIGEMPRLIESLDADLGFGVYPEYSDITFSCTCSEAEGSTPCRHALALWYAAADRLDFDPFLLFLLRGRDRDSLLEGIYGEWEIPYERGTTIAEEPELRISEDFFQLAAPPPEPSQDEYSEQLDVIGGLGFPPFFPSADRGAMQTLRRLWEGKR